MSGGLRASGGVLLFCGIVLGGVSTSHAGHVENAPDGPVVHLKLWDLPDPTETSPDKRAARAVVKAFAERYPEIVRERYLEKYRADPDKYGHRDWRNASVQLHRFSGIEIENMSMDSKPLMAIAGDVAPDILYVNFRQSDTYIRNGFLYPLDLEDDGYMSSLSEEELAFQVHEKIWPVIRRPGPDGETRIWAKPTGGILGKVMLYRKDLLDQAGVDYPTNDWTWDDLYQACRQLADPAKGTYGIMFGGGPQESYNWINYLWSAGGQAMSYDAAKDEWSAVFASREAVVALEFYDRLCNERWRDDSGRLRFGYATKDSDKWRKWKLGQIGFQQAYIDGTLFQHINPDVIGMVAMPLGPDGKRGGEINSFMQGIFAGIKDPVVRDAAWEYLRFIDSEEAVRIRTAILVEGGLGQFVNPIYLRKFGYEDVIRLAPKGWEDTFEIAISSGQPEPYGRNCQLIYEYMTEPIRSARELTRKGQMPEDDQEREAVLLAFLDLAEREANEEMLGILPEEERRLRRRTAFGVLCLIALGFVYVFRQSFRAFRPPEEILTGRKGWQWYRYRWAYLILGPAVLCILFWQYLPLAIGTRMAFQDYQLLQESTWVGLDNFADVLWDRDWWHSVWNTVCYSILVVALTFLPPVILAVLLDEIPRGKVLFRTIFYLPAVITGLVVIYLWKSFYDPSDAGVLNSLLMKVPGIGYAGMGMLLFVIMAVFARRLQLQQAWRPALLCLGSGLLMLAFFGGIVGAIQDQLVMNEPGVAFSWWDALWQRPPLPVEWLQDSRTALVACVVPMVWAGMGPGCLIYLAALKGVAPDFYEAADIDGATFVDKILFVVVPILRPLLIIQFVGVFIGAWKSSAYILAMTGENVHTEVAGLHIFFKAYTELKFGVAAAMAWVLGFMLIWFTMHQLRILSRLEFKTTGGDS